MSVIGKIFSPKSLGFMLGGLPGLAAGAVFDQQRGKFRTNKAYIEHAYQSAAERQGVKEGDVRQGTAESLAARGMLTAGAVAPSRIAQAMGAGGIAPSHTLGERAQNENSREFALERSDLDAAHEQSLRENKADYINNLMNAGVSAAGRAVSLSGSLSDLGSVTTAASGGGVDPATQTKVDAIGSQPLPPVQYAAPSPISSAMGLGNPANWWGGIHPLDPVGHPDSAWNDKQTVTSHGSPNYDFHL